MAAVAEDAAAMGREGESEGEDSSDEGGGEAEAEAEAEAADEPAEGEAEAELAEVEAEVDAEEAAGGAGEEAGGEEGGGGGRATPANSVGVAAADAAGRAPEAGAVPVPSPPDEPEADAPHAQLLTAADVLADSESTLLTCLHLDRYGAAGHSSGNLPGMLGEGWIQRLAEVDLSLGTRSQVLLPLAVAAGADLMAAAPGSVVRGGRTRRDGRGRGGRSEGDRALRLHRARGSRGHPRCEA